MDLYIYYTVNDNNVTIKHISTSFELLYTKAKAAILDDILEYDGEFYQPAVDLFIQAEVSSERHTLNDASSLYIDIPNTTISYRDISEEYYIAVTKLPRQKETEKTSGELYLYYANNDGEITFHNVSSSFDVVYQLAKQRILDDIQEHDAEFFPHATDLFNVAERTKDRQTTDSGYLYVNINNTEMTYESEDGKYVVQVVKLPKPLVIRKLLL